MLLLSGFLMVLLILNQADISCAGDRTTSSNACSCKYSKSTKKANCSHRGLMDVPFCVPNATVSLHLRANNLECRPRQFERFKALKTLDLAGNPVCNLRNDSLIGLSELRFLVLSDCGLTHFNRDFTNGLSNLRDLRLDANAISELKQGVFAEISNLLHLDLRFNEITYLEDNAFSSLSSLMFLDLGDNPSYPNFPSKHTNTLRFGSKSFAGLSELKYLSLRNISIHDAESFPVNIFQPLHNLKKLNLVKFCRVYSNTDYGCPNLHEHLGNVPSLQKLLIDTERMTQLGSGFASLVNLKEIEFVTEDVNYIIKTVSNKTFENLQNSPINRLSLEPWNLVQIEHVMPFTFSVFTDLAVLELSFRSKICNDAINNIFVGLENTLIKHLQVSVKCSSGTEIHSEALTGLSTTKLEVLDLSGSSVKRLNDGEFFRKLPTTIRKIYLDHNMIENVNVTYIHMLEQLLTLDLSDQSKETGKHKRGTSIYIQPDVTPGLEDNEQLVDLTIDTLPAIRHVREESEAEPPKSKNECFPLPFRLQYIDISHSPLFYDILKTFCNSNNSLTSLDISFQRWPSFINNSEILSELWKPLKTLHTLSVLNLNGNGIKHIPVDAFSGQHDLKRLYVSNNLLVHTSFDITNLRGLELIDLSDNALRYVSDGFMSQIENIANQSDFVLHLDKNLLVCDCGTVSFVKWLRDTTVIYQKNNISCKYTNGSQVSLSRVAEIYDQLQNHCQSSQSTSGSKALLILGCVTGIIVLILFVVIVALICRHRRKQLRSEDNERLTLTGKPRR